ncbi:MAG: nucleotidyltransferase family protein [Burkholderiaceae bacterium]|jgi:CTP:molybdopterin cytidylyltransferase MocA|nr:nucleotidyltransferase family protein [Burkholderiaceae bacterium]MCZ8177238.1 nucleotidyltransferase family protein [Burkholderiaceae bacterium]
MGCILKGGGGLYSRVVVGAVVLAAGAGSRLGGRPKCLLELGGVPLIRRTLIALSGAGVDEVVVVLGHHAAQIEPLVQDFPVTLARNPSPDDGQVSSQRIGLAALGGKLDAVLVVLADQPLLGAADITALIGAWKKRPEGARVVQPHVGGERANPVIFDAAVREEILAGAANVGCRQWQAAHADQVHAWPSDNRRYRVDIDTPEDIAAFERDTGHVLRWPAGLAELT